MVNHCLAIAGINDVHCLVGTADVTDPGNTFVYPAPYGSTGPSCGTWTSPCSTIALGIAAALYDRGFLWIGPGKHDASHRSKCQCDSSILRAWWQYWKLTSALKKPHATIAAPEVPQIA